MTRRNATWAALAAAVVVLLLAAVRIADGADTHPLPPADRVVVLGVPGLTWDDIDTDETPHLAAATEHGQSGMLTARGAGSFTCPLDGWTTLGAGNRAMYSDIDRSCDEQRTSAADPRSAADANEDFKFGAEVGALGRAVECTTVYGTAARLAASDGSGESDVRRRGMPSDVDPATWAKRWSTCPLTLMTTPALGHGDRRAVRVAEADRLVGALIGALEHSSATRLLIVGVSDTPGTAPTMNAAIAVGAGDEAGVLRSASTGRTSYVQLIDVAPTVLDVLGIDQPTSMTGRAWQATDDSANAGDRIDEFREATAKADAHRSITAPSFWAWDVLVAGFCLFAVVLLRRGPGTSGLRLAGVAVGSAPVGTFLANLVPWWRADPYWPAYVLAVAGATAVVAAVAWFGPWRRLPFGPPVAVAVVTVGTLAIDVVFGSVLQLDSTLGYNPIVAGRFVGFGNMPFAVYAVAGMIVMAALMAGRARRQVYVVGAVGGVTMVAINGAPGVGSDFGGVLALVPAVVLLTAVAAGHRLTWIGVAAALVGGVVVVSVVAILDHLRPEEAQTHLGRFVGQVLDGTAWQIVDRKLDANLNLLLHSPVAILVPVLLAMCWWLLRASDAPGRLLARSYSPIVAATYVGVATVALVGTAINDSGIAVLVAAGAVAVPLWVASLDKVRK
ncbi:hypothetical protein [Solicola gregarius]|uniref:Uncharacterized protein n=1 Tax=Solicola gregarius TaxID=2908642 RepID=A0AA46YNF4_9ACTN|nr:hypothetical protein [Solicola gregarius]UYM07559.1 hypothetical protein L0C25_10950 [Solicola gregarius]